MQENSLVEFSRDPELATRSQDEGPETSQRCPQRALRLGSSRLDPQEVPLKNQSEPVRKNPWQICIRTNSPAVFELC